MENMHEIFPHLNDDMQKSMLATIVHVDGSAYRREGTTMLFKADGTQIGLLSAGCIEEDLYAQFNVVWENGPTWKSYDMSSKDDLSWGVEGSGCNGVITVLLEPVTVKLKEELMWVESELKVGNWVARARSASKTYYQSKSGQWLVRSVWQFHSPEMKQVDSLIRISVYPHLQF
ncbi:XdhC family protein [Bacillus sp. JCM 19041]|uniref:XdhC family protein n=1 Tax=Bacillus sp. JCM 19041 TaxID=1460637 RepID=UPI0006CFBC39